MRTSKSNNCKSPWPRTGRHGVACRLVGGSFSSVVRDFSKDDSNSYTEWYCAHPVAFRLASSVDAGPRAIQALSGLQLEQKWISEHRAEYSGQWVALQGAHLLASGKNAREVYQAAIRTGVGVPFLARVERDEGPFGGW